MSKEKIKSDVEVLFPEKIVEGYEIKPLTLKQMQGLSPILFEMAPAFKTKKITLDNVEERIDDVIQILFPKLQDILSIILNEKKEVIDNFDFMKLITILLSIITKNIDYLKNSSGLIKQMIEAIVKKR